MNKKIIIKSTMVIVGIAFLCFGIMWLFLFVFNNADVVEAVTTQKPLNNNGVQTLIGAWQTIDFKTADGQAMPYEGVVWVFSETDVRYFENGVELLGRPFNYQWIDNDTIKMSDDITGDQRTWRMKFNNDNYLIVNDIPSDYTRAFIRVIQNETD